MSVSRILVHNTIDLTMTIIIFITVITFIAFMEDSYGIALKYAYPWVELDLYV